MRLRSIAVILQIVLSGSLLAFSGHALPEDSNSDLRTKVEAMARVGSAGSPSFSPDGERLAFVTSLSGLPQVWTVAATGGWPDQVTALQDQISSVRWSPTSDLLAFSLAPGGGMNSQVYLVEPDGTDMRRLTPGGSENNRLGTWTDDGEKLTLSSNMDRPGSMDAYFYELGAGEIQLLARNDGVGQLNDISPDGNLATLFRMKSRGNSNIYLRNLESGEEFLLTPHEGVATAWGGRFADQRTIYLAANVERDRMALARVVLDDDGRPGPLEYVATRDDAELEGFESSHDGQNGALVWNVAGQSEMELMHLESGQRQPGPQLPAALVSGLEFSPDDSRLAMVVAGASRPVDIWMYDLDSGDLTQVTHSPHPGVELDKLVAPELVRFRAHDDLELSGWLYRPKTSGGPGPLVLSFHGGPEGQARPAFRPGFQALLGQGIAVLDVNVRGSSGFGKRFVNLDNGALRVNGVRDIKASWDYVVESGVADPERVGIMGGSYGGYMTMAGLTRYPDLFAAGVNLFGVVNFETFFDQTEPWMAAISKVEYGDPATQREMLRELSPIHQVDQVKAPTLVLHGANDTNVPVVEAEQVVDSLKARDIPVEYVLFPDEGHGFRKTENQVTAMVAIVEWFVEHL